MRLPDVVFEKLKKARIEVYYADRSMTRYWNKRRSNNELRYYTGWYWYKKGRNGKAETDEHGPFHTQMAACRDGFHKMQLQLD